MRAAALVAPGDVSQQDLATILWPLLLLLTLLSCADLFSVALVRWRGRGTIAYRVRQAVYELEEEAVAKALERTAAASAPSTTATTLISRTTNLNSLIVRLSSRASSCVVQCCHTLYPLRIRPYTTFMLSRYPPILPGNIRCPYRLWPLYTSTPGPARLRAERANLTRIWLVAGCLIAPSVLLLVGEAHPAAARASCMYALRWSGSGFGAIGAAVCIGAPESSAGRAAAATKQSAEGEEEEEADGDGDGGKVVMVEDEGDGPMATFHTSFTQLITYCTGLPPKAMPSYLFSLQLPTPSTVSLLPPPHHTHAVLLYYCGEDVLKAWRIATTTTTKASASNPSGSQHMERLFLFATSFHSPLSYYGGCSSR